MEAPKEQPVFTKKRPKQQHVPTRHVCFLFATADDLQGIDQVEYVSVENSARIFVSFASIEAAVTAIKKLKGTISHTLTVTAKPIEVFYCTSSLDVPLLKIPSCPLGVLQNAPAGLILELDFVTPEEEAELIAFLDGQEWEEDIKRRVQHFGFAFDYTSRSVNPSFAKVRDIPPIMSRLFDRLIKAGMPFVPDQITVNEYVPGIGIKPHADTHSAFTDGIASLSLGSAVAFDMKRYDQPEDAPRFSVGLPGRSLLIMTQESRYAWAHTIAARKTDVFNNELIQRQRRISLTFRKVLSVGTECRCEWPLCCESQSSLVVQPPSEIEQTGVLDFYNRIADHFSATRHTPWPKVVDFVTAVGKHQTLLDVGCGNGRHLLAARDTGGVLFGCDIIPRFVRICNDRKLEALLCDALSLPHRSCVFDHVCCVAVIHHFASETRRFRILEELVRVTALKGRILVTAWAFEQDQNSKRKFDAQDVTVPWVLPATHDPTRIEEVGAIEDAKEKRKLAPTSVNRFCHVFVKGELEELIGRLPNVQILDSYYDNANWACIFKKVSL
jgi:alkylated DNA repair protein alkB family protein 8